MCEVRSLYSALDVKYSCPIALVTKYCEPDDSIPCTCLPISTTLSVRLCCVRHIGIRPLPGSDQHFLAQRSTYGYPSRVACITTDFQVTPPRMTVESKDPDTRLVEEVFEYIRRDLPTATVDQARWLVRHHIEENRSSEHGKLCPVCLCMRGLGLN